ncbi:T9SS type A sorting domain-containing protein [Ekhidna sp.]|uniref:T9SS type A sorting domain-containing protein n=1 Tax=Ekhidna sp. TaxID=2608089 RepID=UPI00351346A4
MKKEIITIALLFIGGLTRSQNFDWAIANGGESYQTTYDIVINEDGSTLSTGTFYGDIDVDPGDDELIFAASGGENGENIYIQKLDEKGGLLWAKQITGNVYSPSISIDQSGNIFLSATFSIYTLDADPGEAEYILTPTGRDGLILKLNSEGEFIWAKQIGGDDNQSATRIVTDNNGNVVIAGNFRGTADFNPNQATYDLTSNGNYDNYLLKLDENGNFIWAISYGGNDWEYTYDLLLDSNDEIVVSGYFTNSVDFDSGEGTHEVNSTNTGQPDAFILKLNKNGNFQWVTQFTNVENEAGYYITIDEADNVYTAGNFYGTVTYGEHELTARGDVDIILIKLSSNGELVWAHSMGGYSWDSAYGIASDKSGSVYTTGLYAEIVDMDPGEGTYNLSSVDGSDDIFVQKMTTSGEFVWAISVGSDGFDWGTTIDVSTNGDVFVGGSFRGTVDFNFSEDQFEITSVHQDDAFLLKLIDPRPLGADKKIDEITLFPIPATDKLNIRSGNFSIANATLLSLTGNVIHSWILNGETEMEIPENVPSGTYLLQLTDKQGNQSIYRFQKN